MPLLARACVRVALVLCAFLPLTAPAGRGATCGEGEGGAGGGGGVLGLRAAASSLDELHRPRGDHFSYEGALGPAYWADKFPECGGRAQSPVMIQMGDTRPFDVPTPLQVPDFAWAANKLKILNNGHTVQLVPVDAAATEAQVLRGGPLRGDYVLQQTHFHWGKRDGVGSEHAIDGNYYAMEMHMVFARKRNREMQSYATHGDAAVLTVFFETSGKDNAALQPVVSQLPRVQEVDAQVLSSKAVSVARLLPAERALLVYNGSLTTPPCSEAVTWLIFRRHVTVSPQQLAAFRKLKSPFGRLTENRRPTQPLNGRRVLRVEARRVYQEEWPRSRGARPAPWPQYLALLLTSL